MNHLIRGLACLAILVLLSGCGEGDKSGEGATELAVTLGSPYDGGPRAGESPVAEVLAEKGAGLFKTKGCSACHAFGQKLTCPDLKGVTMRRTSEWMEHQILHPEIMTKEDPISHALLVQYVQQMPNQGVTEDEARCVIEFLKHKDHELGVIP